MPSRRRAGRKAHIDFEKIKILCEAIRHGAYVETAVLVSGIPKATFYAWLKSAAEDDKRGAKGETDYQRVAREVKSALANVELNYVKIIENASKTTWQAAAWMLERRFRERWAKETSTGPIGKAA